MDDFEIITISSDSESRFLREGSEYSTTFENIQGLKHESSAPSNTNQLKGEPQSPREPTQYDEPNDVFTEIDMGEYDEAKDNYFSEYLKAKQEFEEQENPSLEDQILFKKIEDRENQGVAAMKLQMEFQENVNESTFQGLIDGNKSQMQGNGEQIEVESYKADENYQLFCSDEEIPTVPGNPATDKTPINDSAVRNADNDDPPGSIKGAESEEENTPKKPTGASKFKAFKNGNKNKGARTSRVGKKNTPSKRPRKGLNKKAAESLNFDSLFTSNLITKAKENESKPGPADLCGKNKAKALKELVATIPTSENVDTTSDRKAIMESSGKFTRKPRLDGNGGWSHPGMKTSLFNYQLLGVGFMRQRENSAAPKGGFLCDEMGFGKTIQAIANIVDGLNDIDSKEPRTTLIVSPPHLISHWKNQLQEHVKPKVLGHILTYHSREKLDLNLYDQSGGLQNVGIILTTYGEVRKSCCFPIMPTDDENEFKEWKIKNCGPLHRIYFRRIVLDEAHEIKNHLAKASQAIRLLSAKFRWVISGTPIHNSVTEFYPYFNFLRIPSYVKYEDFYNRLVIEDRDHKRLRSVLKAYMLRRTHAETLFGLPILKFPGIDENTVTVGFSTIERLLYNEIIKQFIKKNLSGLLSSGGNNYLVLLLYLRMFTSHLLVAQKSLKSIFTQTFVDEMKTVVNQNPTDDDITIYSLLEKLMTKQPIFANQVGGQESPQSDLLAKFIKFHSTNTDASIIDCILCGSAPPTAYVLPCLHISCMDCFPQMPRDHNKTVCCCGSEVAGCKYCPDFQYLLHNKKGHRKGKSQQPQNELAPSEADWIPIAGKIMPGAKLTAIRSCVSAWVSESEDTKITIFTQFIGMMKILCSMCDKEGWGYVTLSGKIPLHERDARLEAFGKDPRVRVLISSLRTGGTGLDLTMAHKCILVDLWWNDAIEQQAFCRLFRIGQTKNVELVRIAVENTIDDRIQHIQCSKKVHIDEAMSSENLKERQSRSEILEIFGVVEDENAEDGFSFM